MNKELKAKLIKHNEETRAAFPNLYDQRWVEKSADNGFKQLVKDFKKVDQRLGELAEAKSGYNVFAVIYYSAFEAALNTFFVQCLDDSITNCKLILDKFQKITAEIKTK
jgi:hypothetical protein